MLKKTNTMKTILKTVLAAALSLPAFAAQAAQDNIAPLAHATVSDSLSDGCGAACLNDGLIRYDGRGEWACKGSVASWGVMYMPWAQLE